VGAEGRADTAVDVDFSGGAVGEGDAAPKATSQGSNAAGGGAFTAFRGMSAARAEPDTIASAVANKTNFFMTIPISFQKVSPIFRPPGDSNRLAIP
jgi:hypothetical protein